MLMSVVFVYAVCWLPLHVLTIIGQQDPTIFNHNAVHCVWLFSHWLAISNSGVNPVVYFWMNTSYRRGFIQLFACCVMERCSGRVKNYYTSVTSSKISYFMTKEESCCQLFRTKSRKSIDRAANDM